jgi:hypothetical protein
MTIQIISYVLLAAINFVIIGALLSLGWHITKIIIYNTVESLVFEDLEKNV